MKATLRIGGGATEEIMTVKGDKRRPFIEVTLRDRELLLTRTEARMARRTSRTRAARSRRLRPAAHPTVMGPSGINVVAPGGPRAPR
jgi:hypothetical protein